jgi:hypothetical protein
LDDNLVRKNKGGITHNAIRAKLQLIKNITTIIEINVRKAEINGDNWPNRNDRTHMVSHWMRYNESEAPFVSW